EIEHVDGVVGDRVDQLLEAMRVVGAVGGVGAGRHAASEDVAARQNARSYPVPPTGAGLFMIGFRFGFFNKAPVKRMGWIAAGNIRVKTLPLFARQAMAPPGSDDASDDPVFGGPGARHRTAPGDDLPYKVELWSEDHSAVELVLAVTTSSSIGYAAYYAATREYPDRYLALRHRTPGLSRWDARP